MFGDAIGHLLQLIYNNKKLTNSAFYVLEEIGEFTVTVTISMILVNTDMANFKFHV